MDLLQRVSAGQTLAVLVLTDPRVLLHPGRPQPIPPESAPGQPGRKTPTGEPSALSPSIAPQLVQPAGRTGIPEGSEEFYESELSRQAQLMAWLRDRAALTESRIGSSPGLPRTTREPGGIPELGSGRRRIGVRGRLPDRKARPGKFGC